MNSKLDLDLRVAATLDCEYETDGPYREAIVDRAPDRCEPASGGAVCELWIVVKDLCVEDTKRDLLTGADAMVRYTFEMALAALVRDYDDRTRAYAEQLEELERTAVVDRD